MSARLAAVVFVSVWTVASKKSRREAPDTTDSVSEVSPDDPRIPVTSASDIPENETGIDASASTDGTPDDTAVSADTAASADPDSAVNPEYDQAAAVTDNGADVGKRVFALPVDGIPGKAFETDIPVYSITMKDYRAHTGVDISASVGTKVLASSSGHIARIWSDPMMGRSVTIDHGDGIYTTYQNLAEDIAEGIEVGGTVEMGQVIGYVGDSALVEIAEEPHVHLEMKINGDYVDPLDYVTAILRFIITTDISQGQDCPRVCPDLVSYISVSGDRFYDLVGVVLRRACAVYRHVRVLFV